MFRKPILRNIKPDNFNDWGAYVRNRPIHNSEYLLRWAGYVKYSAHPNFRRCIMSVLVARKIAKRIQADYGLSANDISLVWSACQIMSSDPDGCVVNLEDIAGIEIDYEDIEELCGALEECA